VLNAEPINPLLAYNYEYDDEPADIYEYSNDDHTYCHVHGYGCPSCKRRRIVPSQTTVISTTAFLTLDKHVVLGLLELVQKDVAVPICA
jgi:hypothetical protein